MALVIGTNDPEFLNGTADPDIIIGYGGQDLLTGGGGADIFRYTALNDSSYFEADWIGDFEVGVDTIDVTWLTAPNPSVFIYFTTAGTNLYISDGPLTGIDTTSEITIAGVNLRGTDITLPMTTGFVIDNRGGLGTDLYGGLGDDIIYGDTSRTIDEFFSASDGNDLVYAGGGNDTVLGDNGRDTLGGEFGDDILVGGANSDALFGGPGNDTFRYLQAADSALAEPDRIYDFATGADRIDLTALPMPGPGKVIVASAGPDSFVYADTNGDTLQDIAIIVSGYVNGADIGLSNPSDGINYIGSSVYDDLFIGSPWDDVLSGYGGNDILQGGGGADQFYGGIGADTFRYHSDSETGLAAYDTLLDFQTGVDKIDVSSLANTGVFISFLGGSTFVYLDSGMDNTADALIYAFNTTVLYTDLIM